MHVETQHVAQWWANPRGPQNKAWVENYRNSLQARHRSAIVDVVKSLNPKTLVELGSHCGPNLVRLARELPDLKMHGFDVNTEAIEAGRQWMTQLGLSERIVLEAGRIPDATDSVPNGSCDVVLSCYTLAYIAPTDLDAVLYELGRLATKALVLAEPIATDGTKHNAASLRGYSEWAHDYQRASQWIGTLSGWTTRIIPVDPPVDRLNGIFVATAP